MKKLAMALVLIFMSGCGGSGESNEQAYQRGIEEGAGEVCFEVTRISDRVFSQLRSRGLC